MKSLKYAFKDPSLLAIALTHRSAANRHNEQLEFLGDALLGFLIADEICLRYPEAAEGPLTRLRASLVNRDTLAEIARELNVGDFLRLGEGELKSGGWRRDSTLANTLEAIVAAIYLDGGMESNIARLLNHSCDPNCEAIQSRGRIWMTAKRDIKMGEELTFNYGFDLENWEEHVCLCGTERCVGYIVDEDMWPGLLEKMQARGDEVRAMRNGKANGHANGHSNGH